MKSLSGNALIDALEPSLSAVSTVERARAAERLSALGREVIPDLAEIARRHRNAYARAGALETLAHLGGDEVRRALVAALRDRAMLVRLQALLLLHRREWRASVAPHVMRLLDDPSGGVRINAIDIVAERRVRAAARRLLPRLRDDKWYVRQHAARALGLLRARQARRALVGAQQDPRKAVREAAREALVSIASPPTLIR